MKHIVWAKSVGQRSSTIMRTQRKRDNQAARIANHDSREHMRREMIRVLADLDLYSRKAA